MLLLPLGASRNSALERVTSGLPGAADCR